MSDNWLVTHIKKTHKTEFDYWWGDTIMPIRKKCLEEGFTSLPTVKWEQLKVGQRVLSLKDNLGTIIELEEGERLDTIWVQWDDTTLQESGIIFPARQDRILIKIDE